MAEPACYVGVAARDHVDIGREGGFVMFSHGKHVAVSRLNPGDFFAYYAPMTGMGTGETVRAFVAIGEIAPGEPHLAQMAMGEGWRRNAHYFPSQPADVYPLLGQLSFVRDPSHWGMAFRRSLFAVPATDFAVIAQAMGAAAALNSLEI